MTITNPLMVFEKCGDLLKVTADRGSAEPEVKYLNKEHANAMLNYIWTFGLDHPTEAFVVVPAKPH